MFNVWDVCYLIKDFKAYEGKVTFIDVSVTYEVEYKIPRGLFNEDFSRWDFKSDVLFLSKEDAKNAIEEIERIAKVKKENDEKFGERQWTLTEQFKTSFLALHWSK